MQIVKEFVNRVRRMYNGYVILAQKQNGNLYITTAPSADIEIPGHKILFIRRGQAKVTEKEVRQAILES